MDLCQEAGMDIQKPMQEKFERYEKSVNEPNSTFLPKAIMVFFANIVFIFTSAVVQESLGQQNVVI